MTFYVISVEFPDEDKVVFETYDKGLNAGKLKTFSTYDEAKKYASKKFEHFVYNIHER